MEISPQTPTVQDLVDGTLPGLDVLVAGAPRQRIDSVRTTDQVTDARPYELLALGPKVGALTLANVDHLAAQRAIGVVLPQGAPTPSQDVQERCRSWGLAVLRLRPPRAGDLRGAIDRGERHLRMLADGAGPWGILAALSLDVGAPALLLSGSGRILATAGHPADQETIDVARRWLRAGLPQPRPAELEPWYAFPVPAIGRIDSYLFVGRGASGEDAARLAVTQALSVLAADRALRAHRPREDTAAVPEEEPRPEPTEQDEPQAPDVAEPAGPEAPGPAPALALVAPAPDAPPEDGPVEIADHDDLLRLQRPEVLRSLAGALLDQIERYDAERGTELVGTLATFLEHDGRWEQTAAALDVHVNTLRNRLARVEQLTGRDLAELRARVDFALALRARAVAGSG